MNVANVSFERNLLIKQLKIHVGGYSTKFTILIKCPFPVYNLYVDANTVKSQIIVAATINFEWFQRPFLLSKLREVKG